MKITIRLIDKNNNLIKLEITNKDHFSICGECGSSSGQIYDDITPRTYNQDRLLKLWNEHHLKSVTQDVIDEIETLCNDIEAEELPCVDLTSEEVFNEYESRLIAVAMQLKEDGFSITKEMLDDAEVDGVNVTLGEREYICGSYNECENYAREYLEDNAEELMGLYKVPDRIKKYIDIDAWIDDCIGDGLGHNLNRYNGREETQIVDGEEFYLYRQ